MPMYCYTNSRTGETVERFYSVGKAPDRVRVKGRSYRRDIAAEHGQFRNTPGNWPQHSFASGVSPRQVAEVKAKLRARGVDAQFDPKTGYAIYRDRSHRRRCLEARGIYDQDGGYGDPQRK